MADETETEIPAEEVVEEEEEEEEVEEEVEWSVLYALKEVRIHINTFGRFPTSIW